MVDRRDVSVPRIERNSPRVLQNREGEGLALLAAIESDAGSPILSVCYPGCGNDSTPGEYIPDATITYIDPDRAVIRNLSARKTDRVHVQTLEEYAIEHAHDQFDMVYLLNSNAPDKESIAIVRENGKIVVNNWLGHAAQFNSFFWRKSGIVLTGVLVNENGKTRYVTDHAQDSFDTVESEEELVGFTAQLDSDALGMYERSKLVAVPSVIRYIFEIAGIAPQEGEDIVAAYRRFLDEQTEIQKRELQEMEAPDDLEMPLMLARPDGDSIFLPPLPPKLANVVLWVFEKKPQ